MNDSKIKNLSEDLKMEIDKLSFSLSLLRKSVLTLQEGDDNGSYWEGKNAYVSVEKCLNQIENNYRLIENLEKCSSYLDSVSE